MAEAAVIGKTHDIKGQGISAFVTLKEGIAPSDALKDELKQHVVGKIGAIARPDDIFFAAELPKTRSAKIMRRLLRDIAEGRVLGDTTTAGRPHGRGSPEDAVPGRGLAATPCGCSVLSIMRLSSAKRPWASRRFSRRNIDGAAAAL